MWKSIFKYKDETGKLMDYDCSCNLNLTGLKYGSSLQKICLALAPPRQPDPLPSEIWSKKPTKFSVFLWRLRWGFLPSFYTLEAWEMTAPPLCVLCNEEPGTIRHLYFKFLTAHTPNIPLYHVLI